MALKPFKSFACSAAAPQRLRILIAVAVPAWLCWGILVLSGHADERPSAAIPLHGDPAHSHHLRWERLDANEVQITTTGADPWIQLKPLPSEWDGSQYPVLTLEYFCPSGIDELAVYYGQPFTESRVLSAGPLPKAEGWMPWAIDLREATQGRWNGEFRHLRLDWGHQPGVRLRIRNLQLRPLTAGERVQARQAQQVRQQKRQAAARIRDYLQRPFAWQLDSVRVTADQILIQGRGDSLSSAALAEVPMHVAVEALPRLQAVRQVTTDEQGQFTVRLPRFVETRDRITARWCVIDADAATGALAADQLRSALHYATDLSQASAQTLSPKQAASIKGMGGVGNFAILPELVEMGVHQITVNVPLSNLLRSPGSSTGPLFEHAGKTWGINPQQVAGLDQIIGFATRHEIVVAAILLVPFSDTPFGRQLVHPEADKAGQYAMPNLATPEGAEAYEAALAFLAQRYAQPGDPHGRITHWIVHNEVDYGWTWTNMGRQPLARYLDTYVRSMRLVHLTARRFNPHAQVHISLTHHWNVPEDPSWQTYAPREMLRLLADFCRVEGDFPWGVAYHPYPQNLFQAAMWNDPLPTAEDDTPLITIKNLEVLDRFLRQPRLRYQGQQLRTILLSEQGYHAPEEDPEALRRQQAALVYTWRKLRTLPSVQAFHYHRWVDHPQEGGLRLGLRSLPTAEQPYGEKKPAWFVYQALDTPDEPAVTAAARRWLAERAGEHAFMGQSPSTAEPADRGR